MKNTFKFIAKVGGKTLHPKGFYYQGKNIILVGCTVTDHTIRQKFKISDVEIDIFKDEKAL